MPGDSMYQDLQFKDTNLYSVLDKPVAPHQKTPRPPQISKDVEEQEKKLRKWKIAAIAMSVISVVVLLLALAVTFSITTGRKENINNTDLRWLTGKVCVNGEVPCSFCAQNWNYFSGNCYFFSPDSMNWEDSRASCISMQAQLAVIKNDAEETFVEETAHGPVWIGLSKNASKHLIFEDGTALTGNGFFKKPDEPNNLGGSENCIELFPSVFGNLTGWNDIPCQHIKRRLCKQPAFKLTA